MNKLLSLFALLLGLSTTAFAADFSPEQKAEHACLGETALPWRISPMKAESVPQNYAGWTGVYAGNWQGAGKPLCHILVIESIKDDGRVKVLYSTAKPYYEYGTFEGRIVEKADGLQVLELTLGRGTPVSYAKTAAEPGLQARYGQSAMGTMKPVKY